jgi:peroxiredoxin
MATETKASRPTASKAPPPASRPATAATPRARAFAPDGVPRAGEPAPWFTGTTTRGPGVGFDTIAGRWVVMLFFGSVSAPVAQGALKLVAKNANLFDDKRVSFFGVTADPADAARVKARIPGIRFFLDGDLEISRLYGATRATDPKKDVNYTAFWLILDPMLRVLGSFPIEQGEHVMNVITALPPVDKHAGPRVDLWAPVLVLPRIFELALCKRLISYYDTNGGTESGFMRQDGGKTNLVVDHRYKRRTDCVVENETLATQARQAIFLHAVPEIRKAFQFHVTRIERSIVARYNAETSGHFKAHRDDTTAGTAHRRFAVSINLDDSSYEGGDLVFPEFGTRTYRAPTGGAVVFSCSLLHEVKPVTKGNRYAFLPFLYDDAAAQVRETNNAKLGEGVPQYAPSAKANGKKKN